MAAGRQQRLHQAGGHRDREGRLVPAVGLDEISRDVPQQTALPPDPHRSCGSGERTVIHEEKLWLGHPLYRSSATTTRSRVLPRGLRRHGFDARMWFINEERQQHPLRQAATTRARAACMSSLCPINEDDLCVVKEGDPNRYIRLLDPRRYARRADHHHAAVLASDEQLHRTLIVGDGCDNNRWMCRTKEAHTLEPDPYLHVRCEHQDRPQGGAARHVLAVVRVTAS